jgi:hypothetical protein
MPTLDASVAGSTSNSYVSVGVATALLDERLYTTAWLEADATDQAQALMWATQLLDEYCVWYGMPSTVTQALAWPQTGQRDARGQPIPATVIPEPVQRATATYALLLLEDAPPDPTTVEISAVKSRKVGDTQITSKRMANTCTKNSSVIQLPLGNQRQLSSCAVDRYKDRCQQWQRILMNQVNRAKAHFGARHDQLLLYQLLNAG